MLQFLYFCVPKMCSFIKLRSIEWQKMYAYMYVICWEMFVIFCAKVNCETADWWKWKKRWEKCNEKIAKMTQDKMEKCIQPALGSKQTYKDFLAIACALVQNFFSPIKKLRRLKSVLTFEILLHLMLNSQCSHPETLTYWCSALEK